MPMGNMVGNTSLMLFKNCCQINLIAMQYNRIKFCYNVVFQEFILGGDHYEAGDDVIIDETDDW